jgi:hypothetical protein
LNIRAKSVGEVSKLKILCPDDKETYAEVEIYIEDIGVQMSVEHSNVVDLTDTIKINLRHPYLKDIEGMGTDISDFEKMLHLIYGCIVSVESGDETTQRIDMTKEEIDDFIESFNTEQLQAIMKFFESMPKVRHVVDVTNPKTKVKGEVLLEGLESFLE